jgi:hypothetical protein
MTIVSENLENENTLAKRIRAFFKDNKIGHLLRDANAYKSRGVPVVHVFMYLIQLVFLCCSGT